MAIFFSICIFICRTHWCYFCLDYCWRDRNSHGTYIYISFFSFPTRRWFTTNRRILTCLTYRIYCRMGCMALRYNDTPHRDHCNSYIFILFPLRRYFFDRYSLTSWLSNCNHCFGYNVNNKFTSGENLWKHYKRNNDLEMGFYSI